MTYLIRPATLADAYDLAPRLREEDVAEVRAASGRSSLDCILAGVQKGRAWVGCFDGEPFGIYGVVGSPVEGVGWPWMVATPDLIKHQKFFLRRCGEAVRQLHEGFPLLVNWVDARNTVHIRWLRWCGFAFINLHHHYGAERRPFYEFVRIAHV